MNKYFSEERINMEYKSSELEKIVKELTIEEIAVIAVLDEITPKPLPYLIEKLPRGINAMKTVEKLSGRGIVRTELPIINSIHYEPPLISFTPLGRMLRNYLYETKRIISEEEAIYLR